VIFDAVNALSFRKTLRALQPGGTFVTVNPLSETLSPVWLSAFRGGRRLKSVMVQPKGDDLAVIRAWIEAGQVKRLIDTTYPLSAAADAQRYSATNRARGKLVLIVDEQLAALDATAATGDGTNVRQTDQHGRLMVVRA
jgi:NADPH:quinone reductase-like Zn-dependent oxidoreductase